MKSLLNIHVIAAIAMASALPAIAQASSEGTYTPPQLHDTDSAKVCMPSGDQHAFDGHAERYDQGQEIAKVTRQEIHQNAGRNTLNPLEPNYVWWQ